MPILMYGGLPMKGLVIFTSKYGSTEQYARWIGEETGFPVIDLKKDKNIMIDDARIIVIGGWVLASKLTSRSWIIKNWDRIKDRKVILFSASGEEPNEKMKRTILEQSLPPHIRDGISYYPLYGRFIPERLNLGHRIMTGAASKLFGGDPLVRKMMAGFDGVKKENVQSIIEAIRKR